MTPFHVDFSVPAIEQWRELIDRAMRIGIVGEVRTAMVDAIISLQQDPEQFGEPLYRTKIPVGEVCRGVCPPLFVRFVLFRDQKKVFVIAVQAVPSSALDE